MSWYEEAIEEPIRPLVKLLRDNGFNTTCSCGHKMSVEMECYDPEDITRLYNLLMENDYEKFIIEFYWETHPLNHKWLSLQVGNSQSSLRNPNKLPNGKQNKVSDTQKNRLSDT